MVLPIPRRTGQTSLITLIAIPILMGILVLVVMLLRTRDSAIELRNAGVASTLAAVEELVDDSLLIAHPDLLRGLMDRGRKSAHTIARSNLVEGRRLELKIPESGENTGDVVYGNLDRAAGGTFLPFEGNKTPSEAWKKLNAVEVTVRQPNKSSVFTRVVAVLDSSVIGFEAWPDKSIPVVPVALYDSPNPEAPTWGELLRIAKDEWKRERGMPGFRLGSDGLPEIRVRIGPPSRNAPSPEVLAVPLGLGCETPTETAEVIRTGLSVGMTQKWGREFRLDGNNQLPVECASHIEITRSGGETDPVEAAFRLLAASGEARVWPVFEEIDESGKVVLSGFTAARVVTVEPDSQMGGMVLKLQPTIIATPTAVTDPLRTDRSGKPIGNRNVVKVRLAG
jgi:hypothetical protein